jgi:hypothetical protein
MEKRKYAQLVFWGTVWFLMMFVGCSGLGKTLPNYGKIQPNSDVTAAFENYIIKPELNYYISGVESEPNVIIGIDKRYTLVSDLWKYRTFTQPMPLRGIPQKGTLRYYVEGMNTKASRFTTTLQGFDIIDNQGNDIGDWYSILIAPTSVKMLGNNKISIAPPPHDIYKRYEREDSDRTPFILD